jgi:hypothetical protein
MARKLNVHGIVGAAVLMLGALLAPMAQGAQFKSDVTGNVTLSASWEGDVWDMFSTTISCEKGSLHGTAALPSSTLTVTPTYTNCKVGGVLPATVNVTTCDYLLHVGGALGKAWEGTVDYGCTKAGDTIDITVYASAAAHTANTPICHITMAAQTNLQGAKFENEGFPFPPERVWLNGVWTEIKAKQVRNSAACPPGTVENAGKYTVNLNSIRLKAYNIGNGSETGIIVG